MEILERLEKNLIQGRRNKDDEGIDEELTGPGVTELVKEGLDKEMPPKDFLDAISKGMEEVGDKFESGEFFLPDMLAAAEASAEAMDLLAPHLLKGQSNGKGKFLIATVKGDLHDIGKNIVSTMLKGAGYSVIDLGIDVPAEKIVKAAKKERVDFVGLSALLTSTMGEMENVVSRLRDEDVSAKILVGGAPVNQEFAEEIGADAFAHDGFEAVKVAEKLSV